MKLMETGGPHIMEMAYALIEWMSHKSGEPESLFASNKQGQTALYLACINRIKCEEAVVARYLAETLQNFGYNINEVCVLS